MDRLTGKTVGSCEFIWKIKLWETFAAGSFEKDYVLAWLDGYIILFADKLEII